MVVCVSQQFSSKLSQPTSKLKLIRLAPVAQSCSEHVPHQFMEARSERALKLSAHQETGCHVVLTLKSKSDEIEIQCHQCALQQMC